MKCTPEQFCDPEYTIKQVRKTAEQYAAFVLQKGIKDIYLYPKTKSSMTFTNVAERHFLACILMTHLREYVFKTPDDYHEWLKQVARRKGYRLHERSDEAQYED